MVVRGDVRITGTVADANGAGLPGSLEYNGTGTLSVSGVMNHTGTTAATISRGRASFRRVQRFSGPPGVPPSVTIPSVNN